MLKTSINLVALLIALSIFSVVGMLDQGQEMDEQVSRTKSGRPVAHTEVGREYQAGLKSKAYKRELQHLNKLGSELVRHDGTSVEVLPGITEESVARWIHAYISLGQTEQDLRHLLSEEELEKHSETHKTTMEKINKTRKILEEYQATLKESSANPPHTGVSVRTGSSKSVKSGLQLLRIQAEHNRAEVKTKLKMLNRKQDLDKQRQELQWKQESLELETQMVVHEMQEEVVDKFEREMNGSTADDLQHKVPQMLPQAELKKKEVTQVPPLAMKEKVVPDVPLEVPRALPKAELPQENDGQTLFSGARPKMISAGPPSSDLQAAHEVTASEPAQAGRNVEAPSFQPADRPHHLHKDQQDQDANTLNVLTSLSELLVEQTKRARLPAIEPDVFSGNVEKFHLWMNNFETYIENRTACPQERLHFLSRFTSGEARATIEGLLHLHTPDAYDKAKKQLQDRYGNDFITASAFRKRIHEWPAVRPGDGKALRQLSDYLESCKAASRHVTGLESLDCANENNVILKKLPRYIVDRWRRVVDVRLYEPQEGRAASYPSFAEFVNFLSKEARVACGPVLDRYDDPSTSRRAAPASQHRKENARAFLSSVSSDGRTSAPRRRPEDRRHTERTSRSCKICSGQHLIEDCQRFKSMSVSERHNAVTRLGLCRGCLYRGHIWKDCRSRRRWEKCGCSHPTLLHDDARARPRDASARREMGVVRDASNLQEKSRIDRCTQTQATSLKIGVEGDVPLGPSCSHTMIVPVILRNEMEPTQQVIVYAVLDPQSDACFASESTLKKISGQGEDVILQLNTMAGKTRIETQRVTNLSVQGLSVGSGRIILPVTYSRDEIPTERWLIPKREITRKWRHLAHLEEELPPYFPDAEIGLLIGVNCPRAVKPKEIVSGDSYDPWAMKTELGWSIVGITHGSDTNSTCHCARIGQDEVTVCHFALKTHAQEVSPMQVARMLEADFLEERTQKKVSQDDQKFQKIMEDSFHQREDGHVEGPLPLRDQHAAFPDNRKMALKRLRSLKRGFDRDPGLKSAYVTAMEETLAEGYIERVPEEEDVEEGMIWYVPHHAVTHPRKKKIRVVYDCSAEHENTSLNSRLLQGPDYVNSLTGILIRFRKKEVALSCDIKAMFNQVGVSKENRNLLRFLWWEQGDTSREPAEFRVTTHLFGAVSSPACAMYALNMIADKYGPRHGKEAAEFVRRNFYVDDGVTSVEDTETPTQLASDTIKLCGEGGFTLHKFISNEPTVIEALSPYVSRTNLSVEVGRQHPSQFEQALGITWDTVEDTLSFHIEIPDKPMTRRGILSSVSSLYDPLGLISPVILEGKNIIKQLCCDGYSWDEAVPEETVARWLDWKKDIQLLSEVSVPRWYTPGASKMKLYELHHFSDASTFGYGQCSYLRTTDEHGLISTCLVMSKAKVTPKRPVTVPRLELMAAALSVRVGYFLQEEFDIPDIVQYYWTDSQVVLGYIRNETRRFHVFVANRVQQIRQNTSPDQWRYVRSEDNPADLASRGLQAATIKDCDLWWHGPRFLQEAEELPNEAEEIEPQDDDPEVKKRVLATSHQTERRTDDLADRVTVFSNWFKTKRAMAICLRYKRRLLERVRQKRQHTDAEPVPSLTESPIEAEELKTAELVILKSVQRQVYEEEVVTLTAPQNSTEGIRLKKRSDLYRLDPFVAEDGVLRVGGRLKRSGQPFEVVHPVIMPKDHHVTRLIVADKHEKTGHSGRETTLSEVRMSGYWIIKGRSAVGRHIMKCIKCRRLRGSPCGQKMADLPNERVDEAEPFTHSGVDCFGPFFVKERRSEVKRWGILFICLSSRAIHLETLNSMTADAFINAYRRFTCRRGKVRSLYHDRGTNFIGGKGQLEAALSEMDQDAIRRTLLEDSCDWVEFNPITPKASHMGGSWERQIRTVRSALNSLLQDVGQQLDDELLRTLMTEAEAVVNSRPLSCVSMNDTSVVEPITPNHLLTLKSKVVLPLPGRFCRPDVYGRHRWRRVQYLANQFWTRWRREFLPSLQERRKWQHPEPNIGRDDIVVVVDDDAPRNRWPLGRVVSANAGADGLVRSVRVRMGNSEYDRPIHKLILLVKSGAGDSTSGSRCAE